LIKQRKYFNKYPCRATERLVHFPTLSLTALVDNKLVLEHVGFCIQVLIRKQHDKGCSKSACVCALKRENNFGGLALKLWEAIERKYV
jgi:hypothetical protein